MSKFQLSANTVTRFSLVLMLSIGVVQNAFAYSAEAAMDSLIGVLVIVGFLIFTLVSVILYFARVKGKKPGEVNTGRLFLSAVLISFLVFMLLAFGFIAMLG